MPSVRGSANVPAFRMHAPYTRHRGHGMSQWHDRSPSLFIKAGIDIALTKGAAEKKLKIRYTEHQDLESMIGSLPSLNYLIRQKSDDVIR